MIGNFIVFQISSPIIHLIKCHMIISLLQGKVAIITGGASGIGEATARLFADHGARAVVIADIQDELGRGVAESIGLHRCRYVHCDVTDEQQIEAMVESTVQMFGQLDIMFSNAGIMSKGDQTILELDLSAYDKVLAVNARGMAACVKHAARAMVEGGVKGSIVCTASVCATMGSDKFIDYTMSKHAVLGLVRSASKQLGAYGIRVNCVSPAVVATALVCSAAEMGVEEAEKFFGQFVYIKGRGALKVRHVADAVLFLATDDSEFMTGHNLWSCNMKCSASLPLLSNLRSHLHSSYFILSASPKFMTDPTPFNKKLQGKVAIITGGASGIGEATARLFADHGARAVVVADIQDELGRGVAESIGLHRCRYVHCDVTDEQQIKAMVESTVQMFGQLDIMFSNAGIMSMGDQTILELDLSDSDEVFAVNARGMAACVKHAARAMVEGGVKGSIVCTASVAATRGSGKFIDYTMSKHAVLGLMRSASKQLGAYGIRVNCVSPAVVATALLCSEVEMGVEEAEKFFGQFVDLKGRGALKVRHVADAVLFLASDDSEFITGHNLAIDGAVEDLKGHTENKFREKTINKVVEDHKANITSKLEGKVAIITGGASGIGEATARVFSEHGARAIIIADIQDELGQNLASSIGSHFCTFIHCDVTDEDQVKSMVEWTVQKYGQLDIMFSNAGIVNRSDQTVLDLEFSAFDRLFAVNVRGMAACGCIVCTASVGGSHGMARRTDYCMSKHAVVGLVRSASKQLGEHGIRVNCVSPHGIATPMMCKALEMEAEEVEKVYEARTRLKGVLRVRHVADAVLFLASDQSAFVTGHDLLVDGGFST
ncbi:hypothetical protein PVL29_022359 [Vitis rotundifolia]|uniref:Uncharacterized protein n=1 Tax=Vitis rotundifolia TaxID=103349 RepID=A0AA39DCL1_VITRO|nr:hypothetical protein PVL29_022359 [Vitis rotundifolia]